MNLPDEIAAELPTPRDDEPESLRQDIVDELADHLHCSLNRELLSSGQASGRRQPADSPDTGNNEQTAWQQVLARFGPPAQLARQLWFEAMKERIMAQKIVTASAVVIAVAACLVAAVAWQRSEADRRHVVDSLAASHSLVEQLTESQARLFEQLEANEGRLVELAAVASSDPEWVRAEVIVRAGTETGPLVEGAKVKLIPKVAPVGSRRRTLQSELQSADGTTGEYGRADFGLIQAGRYSLHVETRSGWVSSSSVVVPQGKPLTRLIVAPEQPPQAVEVDVRLNWPDDIREQVGDVWVLLWSRHVAYPVESAHWVPIDRIRVSALAGFEVYRAYLISPDGQLYRQQRIQRAFGQERNFVSWETGDMQELDSLTLSDEHCRFTEITFAVDLSDPPAGVASGPDSRTATVVAFDPADMQESQTLQPGSPPTLMIDVPQPVADAIRAAREARDNRDAG